ncbi:IS66 family insertion sequence element accessory protein TnpB [Thomasclavelia sp.]
MLGDISKAQYIYIVTSYTDMRKAVEGLAAIVQQNFKLIPFSNILFYFALTIQKQGNAKKCPVPPGLIPYYLSLLGSSIHIEGKFVNLIEHGANEVENIGLVACQIVKEMRNGSIFR